MKNLNHNSFVNKNNLFRLIYISIIIAICFLLYKYNSNKIIFSHCDKFDDISIESIMDTCPQYNMVIYYPSTENKKVNKDIKVMIEKYVNKLKNEAKYFITTDENKKLDLFIEYEISRINNNIASFIFVVTYLQDNTYLDTAVITKTYNLKTGSQLNLNNFFDKNLNYMDFWAGKAKKFTDKNNALNNDAIDFAIKELKNNSDEGYAAYKFSEDCLHLYFNKQKITKTDAGIYELKIYWQDLSPFLNKNVHIPESYKYGDDNSTSVFSQGNKSNKNNGGNEISENKDENILYFPAFNVNVSENDKIVALTFDDGPHKIYTDKILKHLGKNNIVATFFVLGTRIEYNKELLRRMVDLGCEIGNHSLNHKQLTKLTDAEIKTQIESVNTSIKDVTGYDIRAVRPPYGSSNPNVTKIINKPIVLWSVDPQDWKYKDALKVRDSVLSNVKSGSIILMHDIYESSADASILIINELLKQGYKFVTVSQLLDLDNENTNGTVFTHKK